MAQPIGRCHRSKLRHCDHAKRHWETGVFQSYNRQQTTVRITQSASQREDAGRARTEANITKKRRRLVKDEVAQAVEPEETMPAASPKTLEQVEADLEKARAVRKLFRQKPRKFGWSLAHSDAGVWTDKGSTSERA